MGIGLPDHHARETIAGGATATVAETPTRMTTPVRQAKSGVAIGNKVAPMAATVSGLLRRVSIPRQAEEEEAAAPGQREGQQEKPGFGRWRCRCRPDLFFQG
jgi:hypothetical protein